MFLTETEEGKINSPVILRKYISEGQQADHE